MRDGWGTEDYGDGMGDVWVHLQSEAGVVQNSGFIVMDLEDEEVGPPHQSLEAAMAYVERRYEREGHVSEWRR